MQLFRVQQERVFYVVADDEKEAAIIAADADDEGGCETKITSLHPATREQIKRDDWTNSYPYGQAQEQEDEQTCGEILK